MTGDIDNVQSGVIGFCAYMISLLLNVNKYIINKHKLYKPVAWTFKEAVKAHKAALRTLINRGNSDHEVKSMIVSNVNYWTWKGKNNRHLRSWKYVQSKIKI